MPIGGSVAQPLIPLCRLSGGVITLSATIIWLRREVVNDFLQGLFTHRAQARRS